MHTSVKIINTDRTGGKTMKQPPIRMPKSINKKLREMKHGIILLLLSMVVLNVAQAKELHDSDTLKGSQIAIGESIGMNLGTGNDYGSRAFVSMSFIDGYVPQTTDFPITVTLSFNNGAFSRKMKLTDEGTFLKQKDIFTIHDATFIEVEVEDIEEGEVTNIQIIVGISINRIFPLETAVEPAPSHQFFGQSRSEVLIKWDGISGAEEYQLEWAYIDDYSVQQEKIGPDEIRIPKDLFRSNSTRISTEATQYSIPLIYEDGVILYRVRAVGLHSNNHEAYIFGPWSLEPIAGAWVITFVNRLNYSNFIMIGDVSEKINWQASTVFAEEGKRNTSITYFDGTKRQRQTITKLSTQDEAIVGETYYDIYGREAMQILPVPTNEASLEYYNNFNLKDDGADGVQIKPQDLIDNESEANCAPYGLKLSNNSGAAKYYSPNNDSVNVGYNSLIPDAKGYPYVQIEYTPDNTGRVKTQTGVGEQFILGSGHETKYEYGAPTQEELDAYFGTEIGYSDHYKKTVAVDPNGQATITYQDMQGKTVASSVSGSRPSNLDGLNINSKTITETLLSGTTEQTIDLQAMTKTFHKELIIDNNSEIAINYTITPNDFKLSCASGVLPSLEIGGEGICLECVLDVEIHISDGCGNSIVLNPVNSDLDGDNILVGSEVIAAIETGNYLTCQGINPPVAFGANSEEQLTVGTYSISKVTKINQQAYDYFLNLFLDTTKINCLSSYDEKLDNARNRFNGHNCVWTCEECKANFPLTYGEFLQTLDDEEEVPVSQEGYSEYVDALCHDYCEDQPDVCEIAYKAMLTDVSPLGQYGLFRILVNEEGNSEYMVDTPLSVFNDGENYLTILDNEFFNWKNPHFHSRLYTVDAPNYYYNFDEEDMIKPELATVTIFYDGEIAVPEVIDAVINDWKSNDTPEGYYQVFPHLLKHVEDFIAVWQDSWAHSLVRYHPEFGNHDVCLGMQQQYDFDNQLLKYERIEDVPPELVNSPFTFDPIMSMQNEVAIEASLAQATFITDWNNYLSAKGDDEPTTIWQFAYKLANCPDYDPQNAPLCSTDCMEDFNASTLSYYDRFVNSPNEVWPTFVSLYLSLRQKVKEIVFIERSMYAESYTGCFNTENYDVTANGFNKKEFGRSSHKYLIGHNTEAYNFSQPCYGPYASLYEEKVPRYIQLDDLTVNTGDETETKPENVNVCGDNEAYFKYLETEESISPSDLSDSDKKELQEMGCADSKQQAVERGKLRGNVRYIENCGECPVALFMRDFFKEIHTRNGFMQGSPVVDALNCFPNGMMSYSATELIEQSGLPTTLEHRWNYNHQVGQTYHYRLVAGADFKNIAIVLPTGYTWDDVEDFCCIEYMKSDYEYEYLTADEFNNHPNSRFRIGLIMKQDEGLSKKVMSEGFTDTYILNDCPYTYCIPNQLGLAAVKLLNGLADNADGVPTDLKLIGDNLIRKDYDPVSSSSEVLYVMDTIPEHLDLPLDAYDIYYKGSIFSESKIEIEFSPSRLLDGIVLELETENNQTLDFSTIKRISLYEGIDANSVTVKMFDLDGNPYWGTLTCINAELVRCKSYNYGNN